MKKIIYLIMAVTLLCSCDKEDEAEKPGSIYGVITDKATGELVRAAGVQLNPTGTKTVTGNEGQYEFTELKAGSYSLQVTKTGYSDLTDYKITVTAGKTNKGDVQIEKLPPSLRVVNDKKQDIDTLDFGSAGPNKDSRSFSIFNDGPETLEWEITETTDWITEVSKTNGTLKAGATQSIIITIDREMLGGGEKTAPIHITSDNGSKTLMVTIVGETKIPATLNTLPVTNITTSTAMLNGQIIAVGTPAYTERGFVYATSPMPTLETTIKKITASITENATYSASVAGLALEQTYYVRAYAINSAGTAYSTNEVSFTTIMVLPEVSTQAVTNIKIGNGIATFNGTIVSLGDPAYTERGFCYGIVHNPTVDDDTKKVVSGTGTGVYSSNLTGLTEGNIYYVRAYATNEKGTAYGEEVMLDFNAVMPVVATQQATEVNETSAILNATIVNVGDPAYTERGFVYATFQNPSIEDGTKKTAPGTGAGAYNANLTELTTGTLYYVRAYATNSKDIAYGEQISFTANIPDWVALPVGGIAVQKADIVNNEINWTNASTLCNNSTLGGYTDWRLPTLDELGVMFNNQDIVGGYKKNSSSGYYYYYYHYWSSTKDGSFGYYLLNMTTGSQDSRSAFSSSGSSSFYRYYYYCRCVRTLP
jgi:hypothetical protein